MWSHFDFRPSRVECRIILRKIAWMKRIVMNDSSIEWINQIQMTCHSSAQARHTSLVSWFIQSAIVFLFPFLKFHDLPHFIFTILKLRSKLFLITASHSRDANWQIWRANIHYHITLVSVETNHTAWFDFLIYSIILGAIHQHLGSHFGFRSYKTIIQASSITNRSTFKKLSYRY